MQTFLNFLAHGGLKLIILAIVLIGHVMKRNAEKAARQAQPPRQMPNSMPSQETTTAQQPISMSTPTAPATKPAAKPPVAPQPKVKTNPESPWSSSTNPFDGKKK